MIEITEVKTRKQLKEFAEFVNKLYKGCPYYVPTLFGDELDMFTPSENPSFEECEVVMFLAKRDGETVGRIAGIIQNTYNRLHDCKLVRFTRFDSIDDQEVANALFDAVSGWAKERGINGIVGPLGFNDLDREGLLIDGFDRICTYETQYNYDYYPKLIENYGFKKDADWVEYRLTCPPSIDERYERIGNRILEKYDLRVVKGLKTKQFIEKYGDDVFDLIDEGYGQLYGVVPFSKKTRQLILSQFGVALNTELMVLVVDKDDKPVAYALTLPSLSNALVGSGGHLYPHTIVKLLKAIKKPKEIDFALVSIKTEYQNKGLNAIIFNELMTRFINRGIGYCETNLNLEDNLAVQNMWHNYEREQHKRRRSYFKSIE